MELDFRRVREQLALAQQKLTERFFDQEANHRILVERSRRVAARHPTSDAQAVAHDAVVVRRKDSLWGLPIASVDEVRPVVVCSLPTVAGIVVGLFQVAGRAISLVDLEGLLRVVSPPAHGETVLAAVVSGTPGPVGLLVDEVLGRRAILPGQCSKENSERHLDFVTAVTSDLVNVIDVGRLLGRAEMIVDLAAR